MAFWVGWQLWQKLSTVLGLLIALVLIYASCVLAYNRWSTRRYAAAEAHQKEEEAELYPMLVQDDIPFGARALEQGILIEGIWVSHPNSPVQSPHPPGTPSESRPSTPAMRSTPVLSTFQGPPPSFEKATKSHASLPPYSKHPIHPVHSESDLLTTNRYTYEPQRPGGVYSPVIMSSNPASPTNFKRRSETFANNRKRSSFHSRIVRRSQLFDNKTRDSLRDLEASGPSFVGNETRRPAEQQRTGRMTRNLRRRSSEEFRRRMSAIFNERIHPTLSPEDLQLEPAARKTQRRSFRKSILGHFQS